VVYADPLQDARDQVWFGGTQPTVPMLTEPTSTQREVFYLLGSSDHADLDGSQRAAPAR